MKMFFSKIYNFKSKYPVLYSHVHPDYQKLVDKDCVDSETIVKWVCNKGPDHVWESDLATRIRYFKRRGDCIQDFFMLISSCLSILLWEEGFCDK